MDNNDTIIKFNSLASGSKGNCYYLETKESKILIDLGLSAKEVEYRLSLVGVDPADITAVLVSHEHNDHIRGVGAFSRRYGTKVYINYPTLKNGLTKTKKINAHEFDSQENFVINDLTVTPFSISHDAADPVGFTFSAYDKKVGIATDLGIATNLVKTNLTGCDMLIIESNHDHEMLMSGPYPWFLKQRVRGRHGHLSNSAALELIHEVVTQKTKHIVFAHMSETNNHEKMVYTNVIESYKKEINSKLTFTISGQAKPAAAVQV